MRIDFLLQLHTTVRRFDNARRKGIEEDERNIQNIKQKTSWFQSISDTHENW